MKKQINPTTKAHLIRGVFYLLLLLAVCAIPFALAQRNTSMRSVANLASSPNKVAKIAAAPSSTGAVHSQIAGPAPAFLRILPNPKAPQVVLYDQYNNGASS